MTKRHVTFLLACLASAAAAGGAQSTPSASGLTGTVTRGPTTPVCRVGEPCDAPAANFVLVFTRMRGSIPVRARTDVDGRYRVRLAAGIYTVTSEVPVRIGRGIAPARVHVRAGHVDRIDFSVDTGIR
jgi:hypothetical protein